MASRRTLWLSRTLALAWIGVVIFWPAVGLSVFGVWAAYVMLAGSYYQAYRARSLERGLGFRHCKQYLRGGRECAMAFSWVAKDGGFVRVGFREGDVLPELRPNEFFRNLHRHRGQMATLEVADGGDGPSFRERPRRTVQFAVPSIAEQPPTRRDAFIAFSLASPILLGAIGGIVSYVLLQRLSFDDSIFLPILTLLGPALLEIQLGMIVLGIATRSDDHDAVTRPVRPSTNPGCGAI